MPGLLSHVDPDGLYEFSVVFTDRSLNHMSARFQSAILSVNATLKEVYNADAVALVPGGGTFGMEAVARQFARNRRVLIVRNGWFSFRWTQIIEAGNLTSDTRVMQARRADGTEDGPFAPAPIADVVDAIRKDRPDIVFAPHVETSSGIILPDSYLAELGKAAREVGALFVLDCIASGAIWVDMKAVGVDVLISAPQKGWSGSPAVGLVMMSENALSRMAQQPSDSFALDLAKWRSILEAYEKGGHAYHATMPTDAIQALSVVMDEARSKGFEAMRAAQWELGRKVRALFASKGFVSVAAPGYEAPGVVVVFTQDPDLQNGRKFRDQGLQIAAGVPLQVGEGAGYRSFRIGLFGLDKLNDIDGTVGRLADALGHIG